MTVLPVAQIAERIHKIRHSLPATVRLIAVSKKMPSTAIRAAYGAGIRDFGESQVQEARIKQAELADLSDITWHLIGHLQSNKVRKSVHQFQWVHSVDSCKLAQRLDQYAAESTHVLNCCIQVKLRPDPSKSGFSVETLWAALPQLGELRHLNICGLMVIPPWGLQTTETQMIFAEAKALLDQINHCEISRLRLTELSMGMSSDYSLAIAAGSTMVRLGTILCGDRDRKHPTDLSSNV